MMTDDNQYLAEFEEFLRRCRVSLEASEAAERDTEQLSVEEMCDPSEMAPDPMSEDEFRAAWERFRARHPECVASAEQRIAEIEEE